MLASLACLLLLFTSWETNCALFMGVSDCAASSNCSKLQIITKNETKFDIFHDTDANIVEGNVKDENKVLNYSGSITKNSSVNFSNSTKISGKSSRPVRYYFCGVNDSAITRRRQKRYVLQGAKWKKLELTWAIRKPSSRHEVNQFARSEFDRATKVWSDASKLKFREVSFSTADIDIEVSFFFGSHGDGYNFDEQGGVLGHAFYPGKGIGGDVHFDDAENFQVTTEGHKGNPVSFFFVAVHELGHSLGILHSNDDTALMAPLYQEFGDNFKLPDDDRRAIEYLYGKPKYSPPFRPSPTPARTTTSSFKPTVTGSKTTRRQSTSDGRPTEPTTTTMTTTTPRTILPENLPTKCKLKPPSTPGINYCDANFDAVSHLGGELFFFKDDTVWIHYRDGMIGKYYIENIFPELKDLGINAVDASYSADDGNTIVVFRHNQVVSIRLGEKKATLNLLEDIDIYNTTHIDAAWRWGHNGHVYLLSGDRYWRLGPDRKSQVDYPRDSAVWQNLPHGHITAALTWQGFTYFFVNRAFYEFNNLKMTANEPPRDSASYWLNCPRTSRGEGKMCGAAPALKTHTFFHTTLVTVIFTRIVVFFNTN